MAFSQVTAMQGNMLTIYYYAYVCSCTCCVVNKVTLMACPHHTSPERKSEDIC